MRYSSSLSHPNRHYQTNKYPASHTPTQGGTQKMHLCRRRHARPWQLTRKVAVSQAGCPDLWPVQGVRLLAWLSLTCDFLDGAEHV